MSRGRRKQPVFLPRKMNRPPLRTIDITEENWEEVCRFFPRPPDPIGDAKDLSRGLEILGSVQDETPAIEERIRSIVTTLLVNLGIFSKTRNSHPKRAATEKQILSDVESAAQLLEARLHLLSPETRNQLALRLQHSSCEWMDNSSFMISTLDYLRDISVIAAELRSELPDDRGGNITLHLLRHQDPRDYFMETLISLFAKVRGSTAVTTTVPRVKGAGNGCYAFISAVYFFATCEEIGRAAEFKRLVKTWQQAQAKKVTHKAG